MPIRDLRSLSATSTLPAPAGQEAATAREQEGEQDVRSSYGSTPGGEWPAVVYISILLAYVWIFLSAWVAFARGGSVDLDLTVATALATIFLGLPILVYKTAAAHSHVRRLGIYSFLSSRFDTATGTLSGVEAWAQILLIPAVLAIAATLIGLIRVLVA
jgi:hypothetical protein